MVYFVNNLPTHFISDLEPDWKFSGSTTQPSADGSALLIFMSSDIYLSHLDDLVKALQSTQLYFVHIYAHCNTQILFSSQLIPKYSAPTPATPAWRRALCTLNALFVLKDLRQTIHLEGFFTPVSLIRFSFFFGKRGGNFSGLYLSTLSGLLMARKKDWITWLATNCWPSTSSCITLICSTNQIRSSAATSGWIIACDIMTTTFIVGRSATLQP